MTEAIKTAAIDQPAIAKLWDAFKTLDVDGSGTISAVELGLIMSELGQELTGQQLQQMILEVDVDRSGDIDFDEFQTLMVAKKGDRTSRLQTAFSVLDEDGKGTIALAELERIMGRFGLSKDELEEMVASVDMDGDGAINFEEFCRLMPEDGETSKEGYRDSPVLAPVADHVSAGGAVVVAAGQPADLRAPTDGAAAVAARNQNVAARASASPPAEQLKEILERQVEDEARHDLGTSRLQMQIGLFRLLQGAAYRCFRENYSANHETHLRVRGLPYRISDFVKFLETAVGLYKALGVVEDACHPLLDDLVEAVQSEYRRLETRIADWSTVEKTPAMEAEAERMLEARSEAASAREKFAAGVEYAITLRKKKLRLRDAVEGALAINELNRLRHVDLHAEMATTEQPPSGDPADYLDKWNRVILESADEQIDGAMMPARFWYEEFMPKLLAATSVGTAEDIGPNTTPDEAELDKWYESTREAGRFDQYGADVAEHFSRLPVDKKLAVRQAWRLTRHYLNGVQKRRERLEFGRESGALSGYVSFVDVYLGRSDIADRGMRVSFPYFIGPATWRLFHTTAEIVCEMAEVAQKAAIVAFGDFFKLFAAMYPCPYCRHHLNAYVVQNREVDMYPMEYLVLGHDPTSAEFLMSIDDKLRTVTSGPELRLFFWKLHNTVSSSIARSEEWYRKRDNAFYTTRYWPSLDAELARAQAMRHLSISTDRIRRVYGLLKPAAHLSGLRLELQRLLDDKDSDSVTDLCRLSDEFIAELEQAVLDGRFLQDTYRFDPARVDSAPHFTPEEEEFARSGVFAE